MTGRLGFFTALLTAIVLVGCARAPIKPVESWDAHLARIASLETWELRGKLGARLPDDGGSARMHWQQDQERFRIVLSGPFGQGRTRITGTPNSVRLTQGGQTREAGSASTLIRRATGWVIPVEQLLYWVRGIPSPQNTAESMTRNEAGLLTEMTQNGWHLRYSDYTLVNERWHLPKQIRVSRGETRLTLVVYDWQLSAEVP